MNSKSDRSQTRGPSFKGLQAASELASKSKRSNTKTGTSIELILGRQLWAAGLRYRKNPAGVLGHPDFVFGRAKVAIFCDGDFWHGKNWQERRKKLSNGWNADYWIAKIERNIARDQQVGSQLQSQGWKVMRFWESDIRMRPDEIVNQVKMTIETRLTQASSANE